MARARQQAPGDDSYRWVALSNTTMAVFMSALDGSIVIIALPAIFRGIHLDPLAPGNITYLLWMIMGYRLVQAVLVVTVGRLGDMYGRVKIYNSGFAVFTGASILLSFDPFTGVHGAQWLIGWRVVQALGGSMLTANSAAILTDAFPADRRGFALGINQVAAIAGQFIGLVAGGVLAAIDWRAVFWVNVPVGVFGTVWAYLMLRETGERHPGRIDWWGNVTFAVGLSAILIGVTNAVKPYGGHAMGWTNPAVIGSSFVGLMLLPVDFPYWAFAALITLNGIGVGMFSAPNSASIMSSVPARQRGAASGMRSTFQNTGTALSIGVFFSLMIAGLATSLPAQLLSGLQQEGVSHAVAQHVASLPPVSSLFAAVLGENPVAHLLGPTGALSSLSPAHQHVLTGTELFPRLIASAFHHGLIVVFSVATGLSVLAAAASLLRGGRYVHVEPSASEKGTPHDQHAPPDRSAARGAGRDGLPERNRRHARRA